MNSTLLILIACAMLVGCDFTTPLVDKPDMDIDQAAIGLWEKSADADQTERILVLPLSKQEYLVAFTGVIIPFIGNGGNSLFARACLCKVAGRTLVQLQWFGTSDGTLPDDNRVYQFAAYSIADDTLRFRLLNPDIVGGDVISSEELSESIKAHKNNPALFRDEMAFKKVIK